MNGSEEVNISTLTEAFEKRISMLHSFISQDQRKLHTSSVKSSKKRLSIKPTQATHNLDFSVTEVIEISRKNGINAVDVLKQYCPIEEIPAGGDSPC